MNLNDLLSVVEHVHRRLIATQLERLYVHLVELLAKAQQPTPDISAQIGEALKQIREIHDAAAADGLSNVQSELMARLGATTLMGRPFGSRRSARGD